MVTTPGIVREESDIMAPDLSVSLELPSVVALFFQEPREAWRVKVKILLPPPLSLYHQQTRQVLQKNFPPENRENDSSSLPKTYMKY